MAEAGLSKTESLPQSSPSADLPPVEVSRPESLPHEDRVPKPDEPCTDHSKPADSEPVKKLKILDPAEQHPALTPTPPPTATTTHPDPDDDDDDDNEDEDDTHQSENHHPTPDDSEDNGPLVDMETFGQLLEMDDDEEHSFSKSLTWDYFDQAVTTFKEMDAAVLAGDLLTLSRKGHFLKGSSAALGLNRVKASCEKMQHYGNRKKANGEGALTEGEAMDKCKSLIAQLKEQQKLSKAWLERFYAERNV